jgi:hypothetical protein
MMKRCLKLLTLLFPSEGPRTHDKLQRRLGYAYEITSRQTLTGRESQDRLAIAYPGQVAPDRSARL